MDELAQKRFKKKMKQALEDKENKINEESEKYYTQYLDKFLKPGESMSMLTTIENIDGNYLVTFNNEVEEYVTEKRAFDLVKLIRDFEFYK